jgi:hypothetical protein
MLGWIQNQELAEVRAECAELRASNANLERQVKDTMVSIHTWTKERGSPHVHHPYLDTNAIVDAWPIQ